MVSGEEQAASDDRACSAWAEGQAQQQSPDPKQHSLSCGCTRLVWCLPVASDWCCVPPEACCACAMLLVHQQHSIGHCRWVAMPALTRPDA